MLSLYWSFIKRVFDIGKKVLLVLIVFALVISLFAYFINKDKPKLTSDPIQKNREEIYKVINNPKFNNSDEGKLQTSFYRTALCGIIGEGCSKDINDKNNNFSNSIFGFISKLIISPYANPPASGTYWIYAGLQNNRLFPTAYAAEGIGFASLKPFLTIWKIFRNLAYMLLVLVLIAIGFMIMFRMKINPQTVISIENALPKIIISLILITFSYAIAGFLIDLMYVIIAISIALLSNNSTYYNIGDFQNKFLSSDIGTIWTSVFAVKNKGIMTPLGPTGSEIPFFGGFSTLFYIGDALVGILPHEINDIIRLIVLFLATYSFAFPLMQVIYGSDIHGILDNINILGNSLGKLPKGPTGILIALIVYLIIVPLFLIHGAGWIIGIIVFLTVIFLFIRILVLLFKAYLQILLMVIFSPIFLLFEAIPGRSAFSFWFRNLIAEILTFPIVIILFIVAYIIVNSLPAPGSSISTPPMLGGIDPNAFYVILGMGIIFMIPDFVKLAKGLLGIKEGLPIGIGPGVFFGGGTTIVGGGIGMLGQFGSVGLGLSQLGNIRGWLQRFGKPQEPPSAGAAERGVSEALKTRPGGIETEPRQ